MIEVAQFSCLDDNYGYLIHCAETNETAAVDTPCAKTYQAELDKRGWTLTHIFNTHHHWDHTGGNLELKKAGCGVKVYGPKGESDRIPGIDVALDGGQDLKFGGTTTSIMNVGGHTLGHIAYHFGADGNNDVFCGDALFALGCGKMFEGTPQQFWTSLKGLRELPDETKVYCAHEYTTGNAKFAASVEPGNKALMDRVEQIKKLRAEGKPTVPSLMSEEKETNPFLRCDKSEEIRNNIGVVAGDSDEIAFGKCRKAKDNF